MTEIVSFEIVVNGQPLNPQYQVVSVEATQVSCDNFLASFSIYWSISPEFVAPTDIDLGDGVQISLGYDNNLRPIFWGNINQISLHGDAANGFFFTIDCSSNKNQLQTTETNIVPEIGVNIIEIEVSNNNTEKSGFITVQGNSDLWVGYPIDFPYIGAAEISEVKHIIEDGNWHTTVFTGQNTGYHKNKIVLQTSGGNSIVLDDTTNSIVITNAGTANTLQLTGDGMALKSEKDITIEARQSLKTTSKFATLVSADGDLELKGSMININ